MNEANLFVNTLTAEELETHKSRFPVLYSLMTSDKSPEQYVVLREMSSQLYNAKKSIAFQFYKPISRIG